MTPKTALAAFLAVTFWGGSFVATRVAVAELSPIVVVVLRFALGLATIAAVLVLRGQARLPRRQDIPWLALLGAIGITFHQLLQANGLRTTTATNSAWLVALSPVFTAVFAWAIVRERFGPLRLAGLAIATLGTLLIVGRGALSPRLFAVATAGDVLVLVSAANWAFFTALSKRVMEYYPPALLIGIVMGFGWLLALPLVPLQGDLLEAARLSAREWASIVYLGVFCSGLAYVFWYDALAVTDASALASFLYVEPIVTSVLAATLIGEAIAWVVPIGGAAILLGVWLVNHSERSAVGPS